LKSRAKLASRKHFLSDYRIARLNLLKIGMKMRIKHLREKMGLKQTRLADAVDISKSYLSTLETGRVEKSPSIDVLTRIAEALGVRIGDLFDDAKPVAIVGRVGAGAKVPLVDAFEKGDGLYYIACPSELPNGGRIVGVEIEGDSMFPTYREGDILFYSRDVLGVLTEAVGTNCVCEDESGDVWVKHVKTGSEPGKFHLISLNPVVDNMFDVKLKWASPVKLHWPREFVERR
jgi:transcriptional regulator with XRE-family HTH domain